MQEGYPAFEEEKNLKTIFRFGEPRNILEAKSWKNLQSRLIKN